MTAPGPVQQANLFHTGIVVDDLRAAMDELGDQLGVEWYEGGADVVLSTPAGHRRVTSAYALSKEGPHHVELAQSVAGTIWTAAAPGHAHHLGYWVDDVRAASAELERLGSPLVAAVAMAEDAPPMCAYHRTRSGLFVEIVAKGLRRVLLPSS